MSTNNLIKISTYTNDYGFKVPYLLEIGSPKETNYTTICYPIGNSIFGGNFILEIDYSSLNSTPINPYTKYILNSKSNISLTKEIIKMIFDKKTNKTYKINKLSFDFELNSITNSNCHILISVNDCSKLFANLKLYSLSDVLKWDDTNSLKPFYLKLLVDDFPTNEDLFDYANQLYKVKASLLPKNKNSVEVSNVNE